MQQGLIWPDRPPPPWTRRRPKGPHYPRANPCPGCGAKPGEWKLGRFAAVLVAHRYPPLCDECAWIPEVVKDHLADFTLPPPPDVCPFASGHRKRIVALTGRKEQGFDLFNPADIAHRLPAVWKKLTGMADYRRDDGYTGVERCGRGWRVRPFWRGRKWPLGIYRREEDALKRARLFHLVHGPSDLPPPVLWLPCGDEDRWIAIEREHLDQWKAFVPRRTAVRICRELKAELRDVRPLPGMAAVWWDLLDRLDAAAGTLLYPMVRGDEPAESLTLGV